MIHILFAHRRKKYRSSLKSINNLTLQIINVHLPLSALSLTSRSGPGLWFDSVLQDKRHLIYACCFRAEKLAESFSVVLLV